MATAAAARANDEPTRQAQAAGRIDCGDGGVCQGGIEPVNALYVCKLGADEAQKQFAGERRSCRFHAAWSECSGSEKSAAAVAMRRREGARLGQHFTRIGYLCELQ